MSESPYTEGVLLLFETGSANTQCHTTAVTQVSSHGWTLDTFSQTSIAIFVARQQTLQRLHVVTEHNPNRNATPRELSTIECRT